MKTKWSAYYPENAIAEQIPPGLTLYGRLMHICGIYRDRTAFEYMGSKMSYAALAGNVDRAAVMWKNLGVTYGDKVLLCMGMCPDILFSVYALDCLGAAAVLMIPNSSTEHFEQIAKNTGAKYCLMSFNQYDNYAKSISDTDIGLVVIGKYSDYITGLSRQAFRLYPLSGYDIPVTDFRNRKEPDFKAVTWREAMLASESSASNKPAADKHNMRPCLMLETENETDGGTTGVYNSYVLDASANSTVFILKENERRLDRPARVLCLNEICFAFGFTIGLNAVLLSGQTLIIFTWYDTKRKALPIVRYRPDILVGYGGTVAGLNESISNYSVMRSVSLIICGGSLLTITQKAQMYTRSGKSEEELRICSITGCDEICSFAYTPEGTSSDRMIGIPLPGFIMKIADGETGENLPAGKSGEIAVCPPVYYPGKMKDGKLVPGTLRHLPDGRDWLFTGIIGKMDEKGFFSLISSSGRTYKINSFPVYPALVDRVISMVSGVVDVCSVVIEDVSGPKLVAAVVPSEELLFDNGLLADLKDRIVNECLMVLHESMCPSEVEFLVSLPNDSAGNKDYDSVRERIENDRNSAGN